MCANVCVCEILACNLSYLEVQPHAGCEDAPWRVEEPFGHFRLKSEVKVNKL